MTINIEKVLDHYIQAALWITNDESDESGGVPLERNYDRDDIDPATLNKMREDVSAFVAECHDDLMLWDGDVEGQAGHDFWFTRNHHGVGFWEPEWAKINQAASDHLTEVSHRFGECDLYVGDDGKLYI